MKTLKVSDYKMFEQLVSLKQPALKKAMQNFLRAKYKDVVVTADYIYALYSGNTDTCSNRIFVFNWDGNFIKEYESCTEAANAVGTDRGSISRVCSGLKKTSKGYI